MPKIRALHPDFFTDEAIVELSPLARLLYQGMWVHACDNGHLRDKPKQLKLRILPADDCDIESLVAEIEAVGCITRTDGWIVIPNLRARQKVDKRYFLTCDFPGCKDDRPALTTRREAPPEPEECPPDPQGSHAVTTTGPRRGHDGATESPSTDGDGDGDGDGDIYDTASLTLSAAPSKRRRGTRLPEYWRPTPDLTAWAATEFPWLPLADETDRFCDYWHAKPGAGGVKLDWGKTWKNWIRTAVDRTPSWRRAELAPTGTGPVYFDAADLDD
jgi:hypothetical protein